MVIRSTLFGPKMFKIVSASALISVLAVPSSAFAQNDGRDAQIVVDADTNEVLYESNAREARRPASITKVMTLYLLFDALKKGQLSWNDRIVFSRNAANQPPTKLFVAAGSSIPVQTAVEALVLRSANDVATAVAENLGGSETNFAQLMTAKARELGMSSTTFRNASGLPNSTQRTTAEDLARLAIAIQRDFPDQYHWFSAQEMTWNGQTITGHNHLMKRMQGMDGLKTGYTRASGFNLAATTQRDGRRIVTVVLGGANRFQRDDLVEALTESAYRELGIGATQFAMNSSAYQVNFRDARDAADAAALIMDLPSRPVTSGGVSTIAMARSGRKLGFERGPPAFQVADMTRPAPRWPTNLRTAPVTSRDDAEDGATDEGEEDAGRNSTTSPTPVPFRVAVAPSATPRAVPVPVRVPTSIRVPAIVPTSVPVPAPVPIPVFKPQTVPLRQMAQLEAQSPSVVPPDSKPDASTEAPIVILPPNRYDPRPAVVVFPDKAVPLRGASDAAETVQTASTSEANAPQSTPTQDVIVQVPIQVAEAVPAPVSPLSEAPDQPTAPVVQVAEAAPTQTEQVGTQQDLPEAIPTQPAMTQMAELAQRDAASLSTTNPSAQDTSGQLNGTINLSENHDVAGGLVAPPPAAQTDEVAPKPSAPVQMAELEAEAIMAAQRRQAEATAREQARISEAQSVESERRVAARTAAQAARAVADRQANERRTAERLLAEARAKAQKDKEARELALAEREAARERAVALQAEQRRQAETTRARNARGTAVVQVGAFKDKGDANAAIAQFARFFPSFAQREVSTVSRRDGVWYRARFVGLGAIAAREACGLVSGRGGACQIVGD
jgi:D-alanyl-D-alanine carboxypeptidase